MARVNYADQLLGGVISAFGERLSPPVISIPITSTADLGPLIRAARKQIKMSQQQFADVAGVGRRFLSELENGKPSLEFDKVIACALAAGIDISAKPRMPLLGDSQRATRTPQLPMSERRRFGS